mgnify:CR=1 FL=1
MKKVNKIRNLNREQKVFADNGYRENTTNPRIAFNQEAVYQFNNRDRFSLELYNKIYGDVYYGKHNQERQVVLPDTRNIVEIGDGRKKAYVFNFVADAYGDFKAMMDFYTKNDIFNSFFPLNYIPIEGYINFEDLYESVFSEYYETFVLYIRENSYSKKIRNFETFLKIFSLFVSRSTPVNMFTASKFIESKNCPANVNGLTLVFERKNVNSYRDKEDLLSNPNFSLFNETANLHGFIMDKNEPWKMHFNIHSPRAKNYISNYKRSNNFFDDFYIKVNQYDIYFLKKYLFNFYNRYVTDRPEYTETEMKSCDREIRTKLKKVKRQLLTAAQINQELNSLANQQWWRFYVFTRSCEANLGWTQEQFNQLVEESYRFYLEVDNEEGLSYIDRRINSQLVPKGKVRTYEF